MNRVINTTTRLLPTTYATYLLTGNPDNLTRQEIIDCENVLDNLGDPYEVDGQVQIKKYMGKLTECVVYKFVVRS